MNEFDISQEFLAENINSLGQFVPKRKTGPYSKHDKQARQDEVFKLHFNYGYSAREISQIMNVHRNTINSDISFWYSKIKFSYPKIDFEEMIGKQFTRLELQRTRLRKELDSTKSFDEKITIEKMISEIDGKIMGFYLRVSNSDHSIQYLVQKEVNRFLEKKGHKTRVIYTSQLLDMPEKTYEKVARQKGWERL